MDASALARAIDNFEKSWTSLDWWLNFWTIVVVIGVAVELAVLIIEYVCDWREFRRGIIHSPDRPSLLIFGLGFLGAGLVAIGVAGEFRMHIKAGKIETFMRDATRQLVAIANGEAKSANERAEELRKENLVLEAEIQPRSLSPKQQREIRDALVSFRGRKLVVISHAYDPEGYMFARQLVNVFTSAKLVIEERPIGLGSVSGMGSFSTETGVVVGWPPNQKDFAGKVREALDKIGRVRELKVVPIQGLGEVSVTINWKPFPQ